jgi:endonuclease/exonuclease/phosphatase family metal-dependent hydrolase
MQGPLRVITYNLRKGKGANGRSQIEMAELGAALVDQQADLVLCQEVFHCARKERSQTGHLSEALGLRGFYGPNKHRDVGHHGNSTFSRLSAERFINHDISTNRIERRGALYVRFSLGDQPLHVLNVHLGLSGGQRRAQMAAIEGILEELCGKHEPVLMAGDFNDWRHDLEPFVVSKLGFENALAGKGHVPVPTWHARRPLLSLDRIYVRNLKPKVAGRLDGGRFHELSDHLPLIAELEPA